VETSASEHAEDAAALLRELDAAPAILIGRSYGGDVSIELAVTQPELVRAIVLLDGAPPALDAEAQAWVDELRRVVAEASGGDASTVTEAFFDMVLGPGVWETFPGELREMFEGNAPAIVAEVLGPMCERSVEEIAEIDVPVLLMAPTDALPGMDAATERLAAALPGSRTVLVEGGHLIDPAEPRVLEFVREVLRS
jgi:pimeloyl-ACP methyl ester carboxylesterase